MSQMTTVEARYIANTLQYVNRMQAAIDANAKFAQSFPQVEKAQGQVKTSSIALGAALGALGAQMFARATSAVKKYAMQGIQAAAQYEQTVISIQGIFQGTGMSMQAAADKTKTYLADLRDFAAKTPFELPQTLDAVKRLLSIGYTADDVRKRLLPTIGDIVAALGQPPAAISGVVYAFGQMKSAGRVLSQDLMQIGNALPGFNAKMAIANEMFGGNLQEMQQAMEKGTVSSEQAINAMLVAMQKFGGAAGAMERQSKSLNGVISTFKDTVNNALIDGLMPALPTLSAALNELVGPVSTVATTFAQALGPALIEGTGTILAMAPSITALIPPLMSLSSTLTSGLQVVAAFSPLIVAFAGVLGQLATVLKGVPPPIMIAIGALLLWRKVLAKVGMDTAMFGAKVTAGFIAARMAVTTNVAGMMLALSGLKANLAGLGAAVKMFGAGVVGVFRTIGVAAKGLMASIGPVGWAIMAVSAAVEIFAGNSASTQAAVEQLRGEVDLATGSLKKLGLEYVASQLRENISQDDIDAMRDYGIAFSDIVNAVSTGGPALDDLRAKLDSFRGLEINPLARMSADTIRQTIDGMAGYVDKAKKSASDVAKAQADAAAIAGEAAKATLATQIATMQAEYNERARVDAALTGMERSRVRSAQDAARTKLALEKQVAEGMRAATASATAAINGLTSAYSKMEGYLSREATLDNTKAAFDQLTASLKENGRTLNNNTEKGRENRANVRNLAQSYIDWAKAAKDPEVAQQRLAKGDAALKKALGKKAGDSEVTKMFHRQMKKSQELVDKWKKDKAIALKAGLTVGEEFIWGIIVGLRNKSGELATASAAVGAILPDSASGPDGTDSGSPSKKGKKIGGWFVDGLVIGMRDKAKDAKATAAGLGASMVASLKKSLSTGGGASESISAVFGSLPSAPSMLEGLMGDKKLGKFTEKYAQQFTALGTATGKLDDVLAQIRDLDDRIAANAEGRANLVTYFEGRFGAPGEIDQMVQAAHAGSLSMSDILSTYDQIKDMIDASAEGMGEAGKQRHDTLLAALEADTARLIQLAKDRDLLAARLGAAQESIEKATEVQSGLLDLIGRPLGTESDLSQALNSLTVTADTVLGKFEEIRKVFADRMQAEALQLVAQGAFTGTNAMSEAMASRKGVYDARVAALESSSRRLVELVKLRDDVTKKLEEGQKRLDDLLSDSASMAQKVADGLMGAFKVDSKVVDPTEFRDALKARLEEMRAFTKALDVIRLRGGSQALIDELLAGGVENSGALAAGLAASTDGQIADISAMYQQASELAGAFGQAQADRTYASAITQATAYVDGLRASQGSILAEMDSIKGGINDTLTALAVDAGIGSVVMGQQIALGLRSQYEGITTEMAAIAQGLASTLYPLIRDSFDMGQKMMERLREGARAAARGLLNEIEQIANAIIDAMNKATGGHVAHVNIPKGFLNSAIVSTAAPALDPKLYGAAAYVAGARPPEGGTTVNIMEGAVQVPVSGSVDEATRAKIVATVNESLLAVAREIRRS